VSTKEKTQRDTLSMEVIKFKKKSLMGENEKGKMVE
jgi:hypothetical protein